MDERGRPDQDDKGILDTVRRILHEDQVRTTEPPAEGRQPFARPAAQATTPGPIDDDVLELEPTMMIETPSARTLETDRQLVGDQAEQTARQSLGSLRAVMREQRALLTHRGGPSIEDIIREEIRPLLREWLDANLPGLVEQMVRSEISRIVEREGS